ncbi:MAG: hypothetical protein HOP12_08330, partial [Candidatus Eisenbacteria bacterium]|nr:hypothetical protein [Candidatus Eisenbacteria bacterium]
ALTGGLGECGRGDYRAAATLAEAAGEGGRIASLEHFAADPPLRLRPGADSCRVPFRELYPLAMVRAKLLREIMLFAVDTGAPCLLLDQSAARRLGVRLFEGRGQIAWLGTMHAVTYGVVPSFELGDFTLENVPVAVLPLRKYSAAVHGAKEPVAGVIGVELLRAFTPTLDYPEHELVLRRRTLVAAAAATPVSDGGTVENAVPLEIWSESELMVRGRVRDSRPLALWLHSGFPECGFGASAATLDELSLSAGGGISRAIRGAATVLRGNAWARVQIPSISIGRLREGPVSGWSGALDGALATRHGLGRDGFISHDLFRDWRVTIDWDASRVRFDPEK